MNIKLKTDYLVNVTKDQILEKYASKIKQIFADVRAKKAVWSSDWTGWVNWVQKDHSQSIAKMEELKNSWLKLGVKKVVVLGIGGSFIGSKAGVDFVTDQFAQSDLKVIFVPNFSSNYIGGLLKKIGDQKFGLVVISKSGTTLEPSVGFRLFRTHLYNHHPQIANNLVVVVTDKKRGVLKPLATTHNYLTFPIEDDIGGRYSTLTAVGLLPFVLAGVDVHEVLKGAKKAFDDVYQDDLKTNDAALYACFRNHFFTKQNLKIEALCNYEPDLRYVIEHAKQIFAESEGKNLKGLMPILMNFTTDLHSVGQILQDGPKTFFETTLLVQTTKHNVMVEKSQFNNDDQLDWVAGKSLQEINLQAFKGTVQAHSLEAKVDNLVLEIKDWSAFSFGYLSFWLATAAMLSAYLLEVNPFDQPGVEAYKKRMFKLLNKPGA